MNLSMSRLSKLSAMIRKNPKFVMMRVPGRFRWVKTAAKFAYNLSHKTQRDQLQKSLHERRQNSAFSDVDIKRFTTELKQHGVAFGLTLPAVTVDAISRYAEQAPCYADRNPSHGFLLSQRTQAETALDKPILLAQYMNTASECSDIRTLADDPVLRLIAAEYLGGLPKLVGTSLWWTFPVDASEHDRMNHAHFFHSDVDDFAFVKFFFYLTDVAPRRRLSRMRTPLSPQEATCPVFGPLEDSPLHGRRNPRHLWNRGHPGYSRQKGYGFCRRYVLRAQRHYARTQATTVAADPICTI